LIAAVAIEAFERDLSAPAPAASPAAGAGIIWSGMAETAREMAVRHVVSGHRIVAAQRALVTRLCNDGRDASTAEQLLRQFERSLAMFEDDLRQIDR